MRCYPLSMRTTEPVVLSSKPLRHSRVSADARLISSSSTHSPCRSAVTSVPYHQGCKGLTSNRKHLIFFTKTHTETMTVKERPVCFYIALHTISVKCEALYKNILVFLLLSLFLCEFFVKNIKCFLLPLI